MGRRPKEGRPASEEAALELMESEAQVLRVVPGPHQVAEALGQKPSTMRAIYRKLVELGDVGQTGGGVYYLPDDDEDPEG